MKSVDHLSTLINDEFLDKVGDHEELRLHRTKCSAILKNVLRPCILEEVVQNVGNQKYSIILDESTDVTDNKLLAYCIRYYHEILEQIVVDFLGFQYIVKTTAENLFNEFTKFISKTGLQLNNMIGLGTDGASNLCGKNNSLFVRLKEKIPNLVLVKCICHSLNLCTQKAMNCIPATIGYLLRESHNWFAWSPKRWYEYVLTYKKMNAGKTPRRLPKLANTKWLSLSDCLKVLCEQWNALKAYFSKLSEIRDSDDEAVFKVRILSDMFTNDINRLYLLFLESIINEVNTVNLEFQASDAEIGRIYSDLNKFLAQTARRVFSRKYLGACDHDSIKRAVDHAGRSFGDSLLPIKGINYAEEFCEFLSIFRNDGNTSDFQKEIKK